MAKFNIVDRRRISANGPIRAESTPTTVTHEGAPAYTRDVKSELFLLAVTNFVGEKTFYESAGDRDNRFNQLVREVAVYDPTWLTAFVGWLRREANMRSAPIVAACQGVHARLAAGQHGHNRQLVNAALHRADEPGELLACWHSAFGRDLPLPVKRGVADAVGRLYTERSLLKYDTPARAWRFGDVIERVHPKPDSAWRSALYEHAIARRHGRAELFRHDPLPTLLRRDELDAIPQSERRAWLEQAIDSGRVADRLRAAGMTWESLSGWLNGPMDARAWEAIIPSMGVFALARNLRNFDQAGVSDTVAEQVAARLVDPDEVAASRMFPYRWLAAYEQAPSLRWGHALDRALRASLTNLPDLPGRTLILVDTSGSMTDTMSSKSTMSRVRAAAVFGVALAARSEQVDLHGFASGVFHHAIPRGASVIEQVDRFCRRVGEVGHGTDITGAIRATYRDHDRVVLISDMQTMTGGYGHVSGVRPTDAVPEKAWLYGFNLAGYRPTVIPAGSRRRVEMGGLTDATFSMIPLLERGRSASWPWEPSP